VPSLPIKIAPGGKQDITIDFTPGDAVGYFTDRLELTFESPSHGPFLVIRSITGIIEGSRELIASLAPISPYIPPIKREDPLKRAIIVEGVAPPAMAEIEWATKLPINKIPKNIQHIIEDDETSFSEKFKIVNTQLLGKGFNKKTVADYWKNILWIEEAGLA
jgi:hypothetical protein